MTNDNTHLNAATRFFVGNKWLVITGILGFLLAGICWIWVILFGGAVAPEGDISNVFSFNAALGIFLLSTAVIFSLSPNRNKKDSFF